MEGPDSPAVSASQGGSCNEPGPYSSSPGAVRSHGSPHALAAHDVDRVHEKCSSCDHSASFFRSARWPPSAKSAKRTSQH